MTTTTTYNRASARGIALDVLESAKDAGADEYAEAAQRFLVELESNPRHLPEDCRDWADVLEAYNEVLCANE